MNEFAVGDIYHYEKMEETFKYFFYSFGVFDNLPRKKQLELLKKIKLFLDNTVCDLGKKIKVNGGPTMSDYINAITSLIPEHYLLITELSTASIAITLLLIFAHRIISEQMDVIKEWFISNIGVNEIYVYYNSIINNSTIEELFSNSYNLNKFM